MDLLDFSRLRKRLEINDPKKKVRIFMFSMDNEAITIHGESKEAKHETFLTENSPSGSVGEFFSLENDLFVCIGKSNAKTRRTNVCKAMKSLYDNLKRFDKTEIVFEECEFTEDAIFSLILTSYNYDFLKKTKEETSFLIRSEKHSKIIEVAHLQNISRFLGDTPANMMTPTLFVEYAKKIFEGDDVVIEGHSKDYLKQNQMNLILSVAQGSVQEPKLLRIQYKGKAAEAVDMALVGKGVCFDAGGISIKPSAGMYSMKNDMMGASTLLCSLKMAVILGLKINITATFPLVENLPSGTATKPGDVFISMAGISVEVDNTDAEGRLILADALTLAQRDNPRYLIDAATLTGAMIVALGRVYLGYFTEDDLFAKAIYDCGVESNDPLWRLPLSPFYREALKSHVADINNMGGPDGGSCKAAGFLKEFVDTTKTKWAHFDIAGSMDKGYIPEIYGSEATGRPVRAFVSLIEKLSVEE